MPAVAPPAATSSAVSSALHGVSLLIALQVFSRLSSFLLGLFVTADTFRTAPGVVGMANMQLQLVLALVLFPAREPIRRACMRSATFTLSAFRLSLLCLPLGVVASALCYAAFRYSSSAEELALDPARFAVLLQCGAALVELASEPAYLLVQTRLAVGVRAAVEASAVLVRAAATYYFAVHQHHVLLSFPLAQILYAVVLCAGYYGWMLATGVAFPRGSDAPRSAKLPPTPWIERSLLALAMTFFGQSLEKLLLTEGEKLVLRFSSASLGAQDVFSSVANLASLVARFLFSPVEEMAAALFSRLLHADGGADGSRRANQVLCGKIVNDVLKFMVMLGGVFVSFGPPFAALALDILYRGAFRGTQAPHILSAYCFYLFIIGINGITEAFVYSAATPAQIRRMGVLLIVFSLVYALAGNLLIWTFGTLGIILANMINMLMRVVYSVHFTTDYFVAAGIPFSFRASLPARGVAVVLAVVALLLNVSNNMLPSSLVGRAVHVAIGCVALLGVAATVYVAEREWLASLRALVRQRRGGHSD